MALHHEKPDRCPLQVTFTPEFAARLKKAINPPAGQYKNPTGSNTFALERSLDEDILLSYVGWALCYYANDSYNPGSDTYRDEWGITWRNSRYTTRFGDGFYTEMVERPLSDASRISGYQAPNPDRPQLYAEADWLLKTFKDEYWIGGAVVTTIFETAWALRGYENLLMDFVSDPDCANAVLDIPFRYHLRAAERLVRMGVDMIWIGDDVGAQNAMLVAPDTWRQFLKPLLAQFISTLKAINPAVKIAYHSDGYIYPIIPELIEIGVDILNPIQPKSMDPAKLKKDFGDRLCFWGSIDEQHTLPFGTAEDVKAEVLTRLATIGKDGGLIIGPTHHVQLDTPIENVLALVDTVRKTPYT
jgi:uroporphyrinogen decarboxylase